MTTFRVATSDEALTVGETTVDPYRHADVTLDGPGLADVLSVPGRAVLNASTSDHQRQVALKTLRLGKNPEAGDTTRVPTSGGPYTVANGTAASVDVGASDYCPALHAINVTLTSTELLAVLGNEGVVVFSEGGDSDQRRAVTNVAWQNPQLARVDPDVAAHPDPNLVEA